jgi:hypothetical protein
MVDDIQGVGEGVKGSERSLSKKSTELESMVEVFGVNILKREVY